MKYCADTHSTPVHKFTNTELSTVLVESASMRVQKIQTLQDVFAFCHKMTQ